MRPKTNSASAGKEFAWCIYQCRDCKAPRSHSEQLSPWAREKRKKTTRFDSLPFSENQITTIDLITDKLCTLKLIACFECFQRSSILKWGSVCENSGKGTLVYCFLEFQGCFWVQPSSWNSKAIQCSAYVWVCARMCVRNCWWYHTCRGVNELLMKHMDNRELALTPFPPRCFLRRFTSSGLIY